MAIANIDPYTSSQVFKKEITFSTKDEISGQNIIEGYNVNGPTNISAISLPGGNKYVVPITSDNGNGAPYLKFHLPNGTSGNKIYLTFAVKNPNMVDGYYDYTTGIPTDYKAKLKNFIIATLNPSGQLAAVGVKSRAIRFTTYGSSTNKPSEAVTFWFSFSATFTGPEEVNAQKTTFSSM